MQTGQSPKVIHEECCRFIIWKGFFFLIMLLHEVGGVDGVLGMLLPSSHRVLPESWPIDQQGEGHRIICLGIKWDQG